MTEREKLQAAVAASEERWSKERLGVQEEADAWRRKYEALAKALSDFESRLEEAEQDNLKQAELTEKKWQERQRQWEQEKAQWRASQENG